MEVTETSPLNETTGVSERKPTSWITGTRRPDDNEAHGSGPLQINKRREPPGERDTTPPQALNARTDV